MRRLSPAFCGALLLAAPAVRARAETAGPVVTEVRVEGLEPRPARDLAKALPVKKGRPLQPRQLDLAREAALSFLQNRGWLEATATASAQGGVVTVRAEPGPLYRFARTRFVGLERLSARALKNELTYEEGQPYARSELLRTQSRLFGLGDFDDIDISASTTTAKTADVVIRVKERPLKWLKTGVGWGSEERERLSLAFTHNNVLGRAYTAEANVLYSHIWLEYRGDFVNRHFWGSDAEQRTSVAWRRENRPGYDFERTLGSFGLGTALARHWHLSTQYKISNTVLYKVDPSISAAEPQRPLQSGVSAGLDFDDTDDLFFPSRGIRSGVMVERQGGVLGGDVNLNRGAARGAVYWNPFWRLVGAAAFSGGVVRNSATSTPIPIYERWFMGGATSVRGYREREVGPKDLQGSPLGGNVFTRGGVEARFPLFWRLGGAAFLDGGMVDARENQVWPAKWRWGAGPGLRLRTPVGPLRLDAGWKINPDPGLAKWVIHFSLGEAL